MTSFEIYHGYDPREAVGTWIWEHSVAKRASGPVKFTPLFESQLASRFPNLYKVGGTNRFIFSRFCVADLANHRGSPVLFTDGADMICLTDVYDLWKEPWERNAVMVVKRPDYDATSPKYRGTPMEAFNKSYKRKNWSSVMLINPGHFGWRRINYNQTDPAYWQNFGWLNDKEIGELDPTWNRIVDEGDPVDDAKIMHFTLGVPAMYGHKDSPGANVWWNEAAEALNLCDPTYTELLKTLTKHYKEDRLAA